MAGSIRKLKEDWNYEIEIDEIYVQDALNNIEMLHENDDGFIAVAEKRIKCGHSIIIKLMN